MKEIFDPPTEKCERRHDDRHPQNNDAPNHGHGKQEHHRQNRHVNDKLQVGATQEHKRFHTGSTFINLFNKLSSKLSECRQAEHGGKVSCGNGNDGVHEREHDYLTDIDQHTTNQFTEVDQDDGNE